MSKGVKGFLNINLSLVNNSQSHTYGSTTKPFEIWNFVGWEGGDFSITAFFFLIEPENLASLGLYVSKGFRTLERTV